MQTGDLFHAIPASLPAEISDCLLQSGSVRIERIVSKGQHSPPGFWYDQSEHEWVLLVKGEATLPAPLQTCVEHESDKSRINKVLLPVHSVCVDILTTMRLEKRSR